LTSNIHPSHGLKRPEAKRFCVKLAKLNIPKKLVEVFVDLLEAENLKRGYDWQLIETFSASVYRMD
jgi:hypothetical protein